MLVDLGKIEEQSARITLHELLQLVLEFQRSTIPVIVCGGWVPFLKELKRKGQSMHAMSLDIDLLLPLNPDSAEDVDKASFIIRKSRRFQNKVGSGIGFTKDIADHKLELDLLFPKSSANLEDARIYLYGTTTQLPLLAIQGGSIVPQYTEKVQIEFISGEGGTRETADVTIPDAAGFLTMKSLVTYSRENPKDAYDIYYYCRYSEDVASIRARLSAALDAAEVKMGVSRMKYIFSDPDTKWVDMIVGRFDPANAEEAERIARDVVETIQEALPEVTR